MMSAKAVALQLILAALLSSSLLLSTAEAIDSEKQPTYSNIENNSLCGTDPIGPFPSSPCTVPPGNRLITDHVSGYVFIATSARTTVTVQIVVKDPGLGLNDAAFHSFVATKTETGPVTDTFAFSIPFRMMLHPGATFYFSPTDNVAVSGYLVKE